jgi:AP2 domain
MQVITPRKDPKTAYTSKYVGVCWNDRRKAWRAAISILGTKRVLGYFDSERTAAEAYNEMAKKYGKPYNVLPEEKEHD